MSPNKGSTTHVLNILIDQVLLDSLFLNSRTQNTSKFISSLVFAKHILQTIRFLTFLITASESRRRNSSMALAPSLTMHNTLI